MAVTVEDKAAGVEGGTAGPTSVWPGFGTSGTVEGPATSDELPEGAAAEGFAKASSADSWVSWIAVGWDDVMGTRSLLEKGRDGTEVGQHVGITNSRFLKQREAGVGILRLIRRRVGIVDHSGDWVPRIPVSVMGLGRRMLDGAFEESLKDVMVLGILIEQPHVRSVEHVVLLKNNVGDFLELLVVLHQQAGELDPLQVQLTLRGGTPARANHVPILVPLAAVGVAGLRGLAVVATGDAVGACWRTFVQEQQFGGLGDEVVPNQLDRHVLDFLGVASCGLEI
ncbi:hypothetical protein B0H14DRAFT_2580465 [Mycena olivaceomarginata]|nr:hypothetical protein B0H14DRAFT_2580465 [Mycena olivaceomarginata]